MASVTLVTIVNFAEPAQTNGNHQLHQLRQFWGRLAPTDRRLAFRAFTHFRRLASDRKATKLTGRLHLPKAAAQPAAASTGENPP